MGAVMKSSVAHLILIALMLTLLECVLCYNYGRNRNPSVNQRLDRLDLEEKIEIFTNEMDKILSVVSYEISKKDQGESAQQPRVTVLEVKREEEGEMIRFTVKYNSGEETVATRWFGIDDGYEDVSGINTAVGNGVYETSALFPLPVPGNSSRKLRRYPRNQVWLYLDLPDELFFMELNLTDYEAVDRKIPTPRLEIEPAGDLVYQEGEEFSFKIRTTRYPRHEGGPLSGRMTAFMTADLLEPETGKVVFKNQNEFLEIVEKKQFENYEEMTARIKGTENGVSGLIHLGSRIYDTNGVVNYVQRVITVYLRPSTQEGPFPVDFLGFVEMLGPYRSGGDDVICNLGGDCYYQCYAIGSDITDVTVTRIKADGTTQNLGSNTRGNKAPYEGDKGVIFQIDYVPEEPEKIRCVVENANGKMISKEVNLVVSTPVDIIEEESGIMLINDTEDAASRTFEISCTVTGAPQPKVTFNVYSSYNSEYDQGPDEIIEHGDNKYTMIKTVTYDSKYVNCRWFYLHVSCSAYRDSPYMEFKHYTMTYDSKNPK